jgi:hypothetical protein
MQVTLHSKAIRRPRKCSLMDLNSLLTCLMRPTCLKSPCDNTKCFPRPLCHFQTNYLSSPHIAPPVATRSRVSSLFPYHFKNRQTYQFFAIVKAWPKDIILRTHGQDWNRDALEVLQLWLKERHAICLVTTLPSAETIDDFVILQLDSIPQRSI